MQQRATKNIHIYGDSLTEVGGKNGEFHKFRKLPAWLTDMLLGHSPWGLFSNGPATWADFVALEFEYQQKLQKKSLFKNKFFSQQNNVQCWAQGGATAYNYNSWRSYFKFPKAFYARPFVTHLGAETKKAYTYMGKHKNSFEGSLALNMIGINDLLTIGYMDENGVMRAIQSIKEWVNFYVLNGGRDFYLANMPDITLTPRYQDKTDKEKEQAQTIVNFFNRQLKNLVESYQKHKDANFEPYDTNIILQKDGEITPFRKKAFIIRGEGLKRKVYFWQDQEYLKDDNGDDLVADVQLSKKQWELLDNNTEPSATDDLKNYIKRVALSKAKLNCHLGLLDVHALYQDIHANPEKNGFTIGCALYTTSANDIHLVLENIKTKSKNAVVLQEITDGEISPDDITHQYQVHYIKEGQIIKVDKEKVLSLAENSDSYSAMQEIYKKTSGSASQDAVLIADDRKLRDPAIGGIISLALKDATVNKLSLHLADVSISLSEARKNSGLPKAKRDEVEPAGGCLSWDDVHPTQEVHAKIAGAFIKEIEEKYYPKEQEMFLDDMNSALAPKIPNPAPRRFQEAPDDITAWRKLILTMPYEAVPKKSAKILGISSADFKSQIESNLRLFVNLHHKVKQLHELQKTQKYKKTIQKKLEAFEKLLEKITYEKIQTPGTQPALHKLITDWFDEHQAVLAQHRNPITRFFSKHVHSIETSSTFLVKDTLEKLSHRPAR